MKRFAAHIAVILLAVIIAMVLLDMAYTSVYTRVFPRNKFQYILKMEPQHLDYVFLGSSRTANHIVATDVEKMTGGTAINLGIDGAVLGDNLLEMKLLIDRKVKIKKVFLQVDYLYDKGGVSNIANQAALPFIHNPVVKEYLSDKLEDFNAMYYIPFYRYMATDYATGFREFFFSAINKKNRIDMRDGFVPKTGESTLGTFEFPAKIGMKNETIDEFQKMCSENNIELILFCAPTCSNTTNKKYVTKLKQKFPGFRDYSSSMPDELFYNCGHLSAEGAKQFTKMITEDCIKK